MKKNVLIIFGGANTEYYVSCKSAASVIENIDSDRFHVIKMGVTMNGKWLLTDATSEEIADGKTWLQKSNHVAIISPEKDKGELIVFKDGTVTKQTVDCVFPVIHGFGGEDGKIQSILELANLPYVGSAVAASANAMDKAMSYIFADYCGIRHPQYIMLTKEVYLKGVADSIDTRSIDYPVFVKPASLGSSVGVSKVENESTLWKAIDSAFEYEDKILIEQGIIGKEIKIALLGNDDVEVGEVCEITTEGRVNDYKTKYVDCSSVKKIPAQIENDIKMKAIHYSTKLFQCLECRDFARVDFFLNDKGELYFNEINTVPGISTGSIYSVMFEKKGIPYAVVINRLIDFALDRKK